MAKFQNQFCMRCPKCNRSSRIDVSVQAWVRLVRDGTDADASQDGSHEWEDDSPACCTNCDFTGKVADFKTFQCQNCLKVWNESKLKLEIPDLQERVLSGEPMPAGECPECGALCHQLDNEDELEEEDEEDA